MGKNQNGFSSMAAILTIVTVLAAGGFLVWYYAANRQPIQLNPNEYAAQPANSAVSQENEAIVPGEQEAAVPARSADQRDADDTAAWQTYRNEKCGYEIKYPAKYEPVEDNGGGVNFTTSATAKCHEQGGVTESMCDETNAGPNIGCVLAKDFLNGVPNLQEYLAFGSEDTFAPRDVSFNGVPSLEQYVTPGPADTFTPRSVNVGNLTGTEVEGSGIGGVYKDIYLQKGDYIIVFDILKDGNDTEIATFDKMIATFEFVE